ncbi:site-specific integrase [Streptococcus sp. 400_SSPC]|uniref:site-specific integrase n=1 Tax=Streptococcus sp. 400_SSPC TaxID=1579341 RepID=UPI0006602474|nr:site-specific integrase [Streptococcus sp. 400_SSPC]
MIKKYTTKNGETRYLFQTYLGIDPLTGKERRTTRRGFKTIKEAKQAERNLLLDVEENGLPSGKTKTTFKEIASLWFESYQNTVKPTTAKNLKSKLDTMIENYFEDIQINDITVVFCQDLFLKLSKKYVMYASYTSILNRIMRYAVLLDIINNNPLDKVIKPKSKEIQKKENYYTKEELNKFLTVAKKDSSQVFYTLTHTIAYTGLRIGEALALRWSDINFKDKMISVNHTLVTIDGEQVLQSPKTKASKRTISVDQYTLKFLKDWQLEQKKEFFKLGKPYLHDDNFIFTNSTGTVYVPTEIGKILRRLIKRNNLKPISPHGLRHTHASLLFESGIQPKEISDRLGHNNIRTTLDLYTHINDNQRSNAVDKFIAFMS